MFQAGITNVLESGVVLRCKEDVFLLRFQSTPLLSARVDILVGLHPKRVDVLDGGQASPLKMHSNHVGPAVVFHRSPLSS